VKGQIIQIKEGEVEEGCLKLSILRREGGPSWSSRLRELRNCQDLSGPGGTFWPSAVFDLWTSSDVSVAFYPQQFYTNPVPATVSLVRDPFHLACMVLKEPRDMPCPPETISALVLLASL
jgi:hypothetical protein